MTEYDAGEMHKIAYNGAQLSLTMPFFFFFFFLSFKFFDKE